MVFSMFTFLIGMIVGIIAVFHKLHRRFDVPWSEEIWPLLRIKGLRPPGSVKLVIAGNHGQFRVWLAGNVKYIENEHDLLGYRSEDVEIIKVGTWRTNPICESPYLALLERVSNELLQ